MKRKIFLICAVSAIFGGAFNACATSAKSEVKIQNNGKVDGKKVEISEEKAMADIFEDTLRMLKPTKEELKKRG